MNAPIWINKLWALTKYTVLIQLRHSIQNESFTSTEPSTEAFLDDLKIENDHVKLLFEKGVTISIPNRAVLTRKDESLIFSYKTKNNKSILLTITPKTKHIMPMVKAPLINERKDSQGNIIKLIIDIPPQNISLPQLTALNSLLKNIVSEWKKVSLLKRTAGTMSWIHRNVQFQDIVLFELPGESFLQLLGQQKGDDIRIDIPTEFIVYVPQKRISFEFNSIQYELTAA